MHEDGGPQERRFDAIPTEHIRGCLLGGAVGDALGAPIEFYEVAQIRARFGPAGLRDYAPAYGRSGAITDDTQMTLFTAEGLIRALHRWEGRGIASAVAVTYGAYLRWLETQGEALRQDTPERGWLIEQKELHARRAPGSTCLSALWSGRMGSPEDALNDSKGCGGVMRIAPAGIIGATDPFELGRSRLPVAAARRDRCRRVPREGRGESSRHFGALAGSRGDARGGG